MAHRFAPRSESDLDDICYYVAMESGGIEIASRLIDKVTDRFFLAGQLSLSSAFRDKKFGVDSRTLAAGEYVIVYSNEGEDILVRRVAHGRRWQFRKCQNRKPVLAELRA
jgi:plasmid stabilization system protein ParE